MGEDFFFLSFKYLLRFQKERRDSVLTLCTLYCFPISTAHSADKHQSLFVPGGEQDNAFSPYKDPIHIVMVLFYSKLSVAEVK